MCAEDHLRITTENTTPYWSFRRCYCLYAWQVLCAQGPLCSHLQCPAAHQRAAPPHVARHCSAVQAAAACGASDCHSSGCCWCRRPQVCDCFVCVYCLNTHTHKQTHTQKLYWCTVLCLNASGIRVLCRSLMVSCFLIAPLCKSSIAPGRTCLQFGA